MLKLLYAFFNLTLLCYSALSIISYGSAAASMYHMQSSAPNVNGGGSKVNNKLSSSNGRNKRSFIFDIVATYGIEDDANYEDGEGSLVDDSLEQYTQHASTNSFLDGFSTFSNSTIGHTSDLYGLGLPSTSTQGGSSDNPSSSSGSDSSDGASSDLDVQRERAEAVLSSAEIEAIVANAQKLSKLSTAEIQKLGWKVVFKAELFSLYKRRQSKEGGGGKGKPNGPVEYLLSGEFLDVSPRVFLQSQLDRESRSRWDSTMKTMTSDNTVEAMLRGDDFSIDRLYFRTRWPWPMKDREYFLSRRCKLWRDQAFVLTSRSYEPAPATAISNGNKGAKKADEVIRVDNYWSYATFFSTNSNSSANANANANGYNSIPTPSSDNSGPSSRFISTKATSLAGQTNSYSHTNSNTWRAGSRSGGLYRGRVRLVKEIHKKRFCFSSRAREEKGAQEGSGSNNNDNGSSWQSVPQATAIPPVDVPQVRFVTIFCDDQKVPLPNYITDLLSKAGENVVPGSIDAILADCRRITGEQKQHQQQ